MGHTVLFYYEMTENIHSFVIFFRRPTDLIFDLLGTFNHYWLGIRPNVWFFRERKTEGFTTLLHSLSFSIVLSYYQSFLTRYSTKRLILSGTKDRGIYYSPLFSFLFYSTVVLSIISDLVYNRAFDLLSTVFDRKISRIDRVPGIISGNILLCDVRVDPFLYRDNPFLFDISTWYVRVCEYYNYDRTSDFSLGTMILLLEYHHRFSFIFD